MSVIRLSRGPLLNFWFSPIKLLDPITGEWVTYPTVEHRFQAMKCLFMVSGDQQEAHDEIMNCDHPRIAKQLGRALPISVELWDISAFGYMVEGHIAKFSQHKDLSKDLLRTGSAKLLEARPDPVWGIGRDGEGKNLCGRSLMLVRGLTRKYGN